MFLYSLSDLEATRDELLFEVHKMSQEEEGPKPDKTVREKLILMKVCKVTVMNASQLQILPAPLLRNLHGIRATMYDNHLNLKVSDSKSKGPHNWTMMSCESTVPKIWRLVNMSIIYS